MIPSQWPFDPLVGGHSTITKRSPAELPGKMFRQNPPKPFLSNQTPRCASERSRDLLDFASVSPPPNGVVPKGLEEKRRKWNNCNSWATFVSNNKRDESSFIKKLFVSSSWHDDLGSVTAVLHVIDTLQRYKKMHNKCCKSRTTSLNSTRSLHFCTKKHQKFPEIFVFFRSLLLRDLILGLSNLQNSMRVSARGISFRFQFQQGKNSWILNKNSPNPTLFRFQLQNSE